VFLGGSLRFVAILSRQIDRIRDVKMKIGKTHDTSYALTPFIITTDQLLSGTFSKRGCLKKSL
jgi:hypothetical protein